MLKPGIEFQHPAARANGRVQGDARHAMVPMNDEGHRYDGTEGERRGSDSHARWTHPCGYASRGLRLLPVWPARNGGCACRGGTRCGAPGKHPIGRLVSHGVHDATADRSKIQRWLSAYPDANWALATGATRGEHFLVVVDVDPRNGGDESLAELEAKHGVLPETPRVLTGGGGTHYYFRSCEFTRCAILGPGLELKGANGYVVAPPSLHASGSRYTWDAGAHPEDVPFAEPPEWLSRGRSSATPWRATGGHAGTSFAGRAFAAANLAGVELANGVLPVRCPWADLHGDARGRGSDSSTVILPPRDQHGWGSFCCLHASHGVRTTVDALLTLPPAALVIAGGAEPEKFAAFARAKTRHRRRRGKR